MQDDGRIERLIVSLIPVRLISRLLKEKITKKKKAGRKIETLSVDGIDSVAYKCDSQIEYSRWTDTIDREILYVMNFLHHF